MMWFLEIVCTAHMVACVINPSPNPHGVERYYKTLAACNQAAEAIAKKWEPGRAAWRFRCLPIKQ